ncbi:hypothetical protein [Nostoc sp.]|uniref:hypothetical protein n=1 Tax=Nostoc sp. TaxID=1180 RepID=UPI002FFD43AD
MLVLSLYCYHLLLAQKHVIFQRSHRDISNQDIFILLQDVPRIKLIKNDLNSKTPTEVALSRETSVSKTEYLALASSKVIKGTSKITL